MDDLMTQSFNAAPQGSHHLDDYLTQLTGQSLSTTIPDSHPISQSWSPALSTGAKRSPPETVEEEDEEHLPSSPTSEELPKWLREAKSMKRKQSTGGRSVGSNYLDSYLGNLTHHSWLSYAPSTPTTQQSLYMPKRVYLYPDAYYKNENLPQQKLFMSRSFTEGISDPSFDVFGGDFSQTMHKETPKSDGASSKQTLDSNEVAALRDTDSPATEHSAPNLTREVSVAPSNGTESGMGTDDVCQTIQLSSSQGFSPGVPETINSEPDPSFAVDSLETDPPGGGTETSGVVTLESTSEKELPQESAEDEVTISENFPDIPFEPEFAVKKSDKDDQNPKTDARTNSGTVSTNEFQEENSTSNGSDDSSCCTQPSTILILTEVQSASDSQTLEKSSYPDVSENNNNCNKKEDMNNRLNASMNKGDTVTTKLDSTISSLNSDSKSVFRISELSLDSNDNSLEELKMREKKPAPALNAGHVRTVSFDISTPARSSTSTPEASLMSTSSEVLGSSLNVSDDGNANANDSIRSVLDSNSIRDTSLDSIGENSELVQDSNTAEDPLGSYTKTSSDSSCGTVLETPVENPMSKSIIENGVQNQDGVETTSVSVAKIVPVSERKESLIAISHPSVQTSLSHSYSPVGSASSLMSAHVTSSSGVSSCSPMTPNKATFMSPNSTAPSSAPFCPSGGFPVSKATTPISSPHRHSTPTTPSSHNVYSPVTGGPPKCSSRQHQINALLQLLRVQHHHEREQLVAKQQEEMQQFVQHLQKLTPAQLQHIVSSQLNSVQSNRMNRVTPVEADTKSPSTGEFPPSSSQQTTPAAESSSPCEDSYSGNNSIAASQSTPSLSEGSKAVSNHTNIMPSFYLHNPASTATGATTPGHLNKLFLQFPSKKIQSPSGGISSHKACTPPHYPKSSHYNISPSHALPHSHSTLDLTRPRHFSRSQSDGTGDPSGKESSCVSLPPDISTHPPSVAVSKPTKQAFNEKQANYGSRSSSSSSVIKEKLLTNQKNSSQLAPITPREDMADLSSSLTNSDIFNSLQSSVVSEGGTEKQNARNASRNGPISKMTTETFLPSGLQKLRRTDVSIFN